MKLSRETLDAVYKLNDANEAYSVFLSFKFIVFLLYIRRLIKF